MSSIRRKRAADQVASSETRLTPCQPRSVNALRPESEGWSAPELTVLARLYVNVLMLTAAALLEADPGDPTADQGIVAEALIQLRLISVGRLHWTAER
jgi:hypothetical protein